jgi:6-phosphogluconate dehydrogenase (decarboxylating)
MQGGNVKDFFSAMILTLTRLPYRQLSKPMQYMDQNKYVLQLQRLTKRHTAWLMFFVKTIDTQGIDPHAPRLYETEIVLNSGNCLFLQK